MTFEVFIVVTTVVWDRTLCSLTEIYWRSGELLSKYSGYNIYVWRPVVI